MRVGPGSLPENRAYVAALLADLTTRYPVAGVQREAAQFLPWAPAHHHFKVGFPLGVGGDLLLSLCFCGACRAAGEAAGLDVAALRRRVTEALLVRWQGDNEPLSFGEARSTISDLDAYLAVRAGSVLDLLAAARAACSGPLPLIIPSGSLDRPGLTGLELDRLGGLVNGVALGCYRPTAALVAADVRCAQAALPARLTLVANLNVADPGLDGPTELGAKVRAARRAGADAIAFYNYGLLPLGRLAWIAAARGRSSGRRSSPAETGRSRPGDHPEGGPQRV